MENKKDILRLLERVTNGDATDQEIRAYNRWCNGFQAKGMPVPRAEEITADMLPDIKKQLFHQRKGSSSRLWRKVAAAAAVILVLVTAGYYLINKPENVQLVQAQRNGVPGSNKATLTLASGQTIILDNAPTGQVASQGASSITKANGGLLVYQGRKPETRRGHHETPHFFNTLTIPRGGQYRLVLPDGTKVWINSASSIRYPVAFTGDERRVFVSGELYMEVAEDANHPFVVVTRNSDIRVLGTRFNVKAYDNESAVNTTLLEGSVKVSVPAGKTAIVIKPGEQAIVGNGNNNIGVKKVNAANVAAWIHGLLSLEDCSVPEFMNQLSRWYNVDVEYVGEVPEKRFGGMINRNAPLSDVLSALNAGGIHTELKENKIIVLSH